MSFHAPGPRSLEEEHKNRRLHYRGSNEHDNAHAISLPWALSCRGTGLCTADVQPDYAATSKFREG